MNWEKLAKSELLSTQVGSHMDKAWIMFTRSPHVGSEYYCVLVGKLSKLLRQIPWTLNGLRGELAWEWSACLFVSFCKGERKPQKHLHFLNRLLVKYILKGSMEKSSSINAQ